MMDFSLLSIIWSVAIIISIILILITKKNKKILILIAIIMIFLSILTCYIIYLISSLDDTNIDSPKEDFPYGIQYNLTSFEDSIILFVGPFQDNDGYVLSNANIKVFFNNTFFSNGTTDENAIYQLQISNHTLSKYQNKSFIIKLNHEKVNQGNSIEFEGILNYKGKIFVKD